MKNETREKEARGERTMRDTENKAKENSVRGLELTAEKINSYSACLLYTSPSPRDPKTSRMPSSA